MVLVNGKGLQHLLNTDVLKRTPALNYLKKEL